MKVFVIPNRSKRDAVPVMQKAGDILCGAGATILMDDKSAACASPGWDVRILQEEAAYAECDIVLTIGGDGTLLHAAKRAIPVQKPLAGINIGRLGFLTAIEADELDILRRLCRGEYKIERRGVLCASYGGCPPFLAVNDAVIFKQNPERTIGLDIYCDDILVSRFRGDGIVFATPTGSTAYALSAGGPVLDARLNGVVVTQICAHIVHTPPLVFSADRVLRAVSTGAQDEKAVIICDGARGPVIRRNGEVHITQARQTMQLVQFSDANQLESIDRKLKGR